VLTTVAKGGAVDVNRAVAAARAAFEGEWWLWTPAQRQRQRLLFRVSEVLRERAAEFAQLESLDNGKSAGVAEAVDILWCAELFAYYAGWATKIEGRVIATMTGKSVDADETMNPIGLGPG